jgi:hypothetical protein
MPWVDEQARGICVLRCTVFSLKWTKVAEKTYAVLKAKAEASVAARKKKKKPKSSKQEGLFKQVHKTVILLASNPKHPGLQTHEYDGIENPYEPMEKVWEAYAQNHTPGAYRVFWCYGPAQKEITIIATTPHP